MIDFVKGKIVLVDNPYIVVEVNGIGYQVHCPNPFIYQKNMETSITIFTYQYVREDVIRLYGFSTRDERLLFEKLLDVSGIGPKGALAILAAGQPEQVIEAIETENEQFLIKFPGVGKKTARQIILDLKGKLTTFASFPANPIHLTSQQENEAQSTLDEALEALVSLGYTEKEIKKIVPKLRELPTLPTDEYIKKALQLLLNG